MELKRVVGDLKSDIGAKTLCHGAEHGGIRILAIQRRGGAPQKGAGGLELDRHVGEAELQRLEFVEALSKSLALLHVGAGLVERGLRTAERAGRDVEAATVEAGHRDLEADALLAQPVLNRHARI